MSMSNGTSTSRGQRPPHWPALNWARRLDQVLVRLLVLLVEQVVVVDQPLLAESLLEPVVERGALAGLPGGGCGIGRRTWRASASGSRASATRAETDSRAGSSDLDRAVAPVPQPPPLGQQQSRVQLPGGGELASAGVVSQPAVAACRGSAPPPRRGRGPRPARGRGRPPRPARPPRPRRRGAARPGWRASPPRPRRPAAGSPRRRPAARPTARPSPRRPRTPGGPRSGRPTARGRRSRRPTSSPSSRARRRPGWRRRSRACAPRPGRGRRRRR